MIKTDPPKIIAEISCNHMQDIDKGYQLIDAAKEAGADYVKIQFYHPSDMYIRDVIIPYGSGTPWDGEFLRDVYNQGYMSQTMAESLFKYAKRKDITLFSSVFSLSGLEFLEKLGCPIYKIASFENNDLELIYRVSQTNKPIIVSTGTCKTDKEIFDIKDSVIDSSKLTFMHCISAYPTYKEEANISQISHLGYITNLPIGFSDHTQDFVAACAAAAVGATVIERHLMLYGDENSLDSSFSTTPRDFTIYVKSIKDIYSTLYSRFDPQEPYMQFKRSLFIYETVQPGDKFTHHNIRAYRPYMGLDPSFLLKLIGKKSTKTLIAGNPLTLDDIEGVTQ